MVSTNLLMTELRLEKTELLSLKDAAMAQRT